MRQAFAALGVVHSRRRLVAHCLRPALAALAAGIPRARRFGCTALLVSQAFGPLPALAAPAIIPSCDAAEAAARRQQNDLLAALPRLQVLLLGEIHTSTADHLWQLRTLEALQPRRPLSLALEMIPAPRQPLLTRYGTGLLSEQAFLQQVGWQQVWGHDPDLYLPLLRWARQQHVPLLAINAEPDLVRRVRREGLAAIPPAERQGIGIPAPASPADRRRLEVAWRWHRPLEATAPAADPVDSSPSPGAGPQTQLPRAAAASLPASRARSVQGAAIPAQGAEPHPELVRAAPVDGPSAGPLATSAPRAAGLARGRSPLLAAPPADLERFIASQLLRDRAMAERIAAAHRQAPDGLVVVLIGQGHLEGDGGLPLQLRHLGVTRLLALRRPQLPPGCGPAPARARLGAFLESEAGQVWVRRVAPGSAAEAAGIRSGDRILELNGTAVDHAGQVIRGVRLHPDGMPLRLLLERDGRRLRLQLRLPPSGEPRQAARDNGVWVGERSLSAPPRLPPPLSFALSPP